MTKILISFQKAQDTCEEADVGSPGIMICGDQKVTQQKIGRMGLCLLMILMGRYSAAERSGISLAKAAAGESWVHFWDDMRQNAKSASGDALIQKEDRR